MNLLFLNSARKWGGNEAWVINAAHLLAKRHHVVLAYRKNEIGDRFNVPKYALPFLNEADLYTIFQLLRIIKKHKIDIIIPSKRKEYVLAGIASKLAGIKNVLILGIVRDLEGKAIYNLVYNKLADGIMVNAKMIKDVLLKSPYMKGEKIAVIPNGLSINASEIVPAEKKYEFTVTSLAELSERKGFDFLIKGFARFVKEHDVKDAGLVIMGTGEKLEFLKELAASLNVGDRVSFLGFIKNPFPYLASSDVFALTSKNEGIPYATLEAALLHNAIITTNAGGVEEIFIHNQNSLLVDYGDEKTLADDFFRLYQDKQLRKTLADNAFMAVRKDFSLEKMEADMIGFFSKVSGKN